MEEEVQKLTEVNTSLKIRIEQLEASDFMRNQDTVKQIQKNEKLENNVKYLTGKTTDPENRSRRENLKIIGLSESHDQKKSLDIIFQEMIKENCPDILEPEGKIEIERIHRSPPVRDPQRKIPGNVVAKFQSSQVKEKILQTARKKKFKYCGNTIRITQDLATSTLRDRRGWNIIFWRAKEIGLQPRITYPAKLSTVLQGKKWSLSEIEDFQAFLMKRPELNRKFDFQIQDSSRT
uniref:L1 transposable element RRM domain-containing protein n=1 Tax=Vombatus ursinus TaxID=29139 RepID=A0A4X2M969_VOMUR